MEEIYKDIKDLEGKYQVSNLGNIMTLNYKHTGKPGLMKLRKNKQGYLMINLYKDGKHKTYRIHRLVAETFLENPNNLPEVNHKDEDKTNNRVDNLEWCDRKYNINYGTCIERISKTQSKPVLQFTLDGEFVREYPSRKEVERNGFNRGGIYLCCIGKKPQYKGFIWRYK